jgi:hypothetical protein
MTGQPTESSQRRAQLGRGTAWLTPRPQAEESATTVELTTSGNTLLVTGNESHQVVVTHLEIGNGDSADEVVYVRIGASGDAKHKGPVRGGSVVTRNLLGSELVLGRGENLYGNRSGSSGTVYITVCFFYY